MRMDVGTLGGIGAGLFVVGLAIFMGGTVTVFLNLPSLILVLGGACAATALRFPVDAVFAAIATGLKTAFLDQRRTPGELLDDLRGLAAIMRRQGPMGLERAPVSEPFLARGRQMIADGLPADQLRIQLTRERDLEMQRLVDGERVFRALGEAGPAFGMIGTVVGLVQMLWRMDDPSTIGPSMALALLTTLYGALLAYAIALPIADRLAMKHEAQQTNLSLIIDGLVEVAQRRSPDAVTDMLIVYLPEKARGAFASAPA